MEKIVDSTSIIGVLPDKVVIWIQFGTRYFIDYIYLIIGIPLFIDFLVAWSPKLGMQFGLTENNNSVNKVKDSSDIGNNVQLDDKFKFMYIYARNPKLFTSKEKLETLDKEIVDIRSSYQPHSDKGKSKTDGNQSKSSSNKKSIENNSKQKNKSIEKASTSFTDRLLRNGLNTIHLTFIAVVIAVNVAGYIHYSSLFDKYFKMTDKGYILSYDALENINKEEKAEVLKMNVKVELINEVKYIK
jgi:hypothetical protein